MLNQEIDLRLLKNCTSFDSLNCVDHEVTGRMCRHLHFAQATISLAVKKGGLRKKCKEFLIEISLIGLLVNYLFINKEWK